MDCPASAESETWALASSIGEIARATLAAKGRLRPESTRLQCLPIRRGAEVCGLHFALRGPREVLMTAVWDASTGMLWCYDSRGDRFCRQEVSVPDGAEKMIDAVRFD